MTTFLLLLGFSLVSSSVLFGLSASSAAFSSVFFYLPIYRISRNLFVILELGAGSIFFLQRCKRKRLKKGVVQKRVFLFLGLESFILAADVWACGVTLYAMLFGDYPFRRYPKAPKDFYDLIRRILEVEVSIPEDISVSLECRDLIYRILNKDPARRITMPEIKNHVWFLKNLVVDENTSGNQFEEPMQSLEAITKIISDAKRIISDAKTGG